MFNPFRTNPRISLIVPYRADKRSLRARNWRWLKQYWENELPDAEIIVCDSKSKIFSKTQAVNNGFKKSRGDIIVILDADAYMYGSVIKDTVRRIDYARSRDQNRWWIPYRFLYRLREPITQEILASDPAYPLRPSTPPRSYDIESTIGSLHGKRYGAMIQIVPREAFELIGGMDPRFIGWGAEDISFARALDTLYGRHKTIMAEVIHLWHPKIDVTATSRRWEGQSSDQPNSHLGSRYSRATGDIVAMRKLVDEGFDWEDRQRWDYKFRERVKKWLDKI